MNRTQEFRALISASQPSTATAAAAQSSSSVAANDAFNALVLSVIEPIRAALRKLMSPSFRRSFVAMNSTAAPASAYSETSQNSTQTMTDSDRAAFVEEMFLLERSSHEPLERLRRMIAQNAPSAISNLLGRGDSSGNDLHQHRQAILLLISRALVQISDELKSLQKIRNEYSENFKISMVSPAFQQALADARLSSAAQSKSDSFRRIEPSKTSIPDQPASATTPSDSQQFESESDFPSKTLQSTSSQLAQGEPLQPALAASSSTSNKPSNVLKADTSGLRSRGKQSRVSDSAPSFQSASDTALAEEEQFQQESQQMLETFESELESIRASETKLAAISALMSDFSTRVMEQAETIDSVLDLTQQSTEHLDRGQKELLEASQQSVYFRLLVPFALLLTGVALLLVDWRQ